MLYVQPRNDTLQNSSVMYSKYKYLNITLNYTTWVLNKVIHVSPIHNKEESRVEYKRR